MAYPYGAFLRKPVGPVGTQSRNTSTGKCEQFSYRETRPRLAVFCKNLRMTEERWGEQWNVGDRIRYHHPDPSRHQTVEGTIVDKSWGRDGGEPIYHFTVVADGETSGWIVGPRNIQSATGEFPVEGARQRGDANPHPDMPPHADDEPNPSDTAAALKFPEPFPEKTGFGSLDAENQKEWRKDKARWEKEHGL